MMCHETLGDQGELGQTRVGQGLACEIDAKPAKPSRTTGQWLTAA